VSDDGTVIALSGGIGGAKLALGLARVLDPARLTVMVNTADDFEAFGLLHVSPDIDTMMYTLANRANPESGWGRANETWRFMESLDELGGETWFNLGDADLATHVERTRRLRAGETLSAITDDFRQRLGVTPRIRPMTDDRVRTVVETTEGPLPFQEYFVHRQCEPAVTGFRYDGAAQARSDPELLATLADPNTAAVVLCPSNPFISIDPILALPDLRQALADAPTPVVAVSPIVGGAALKGPTAKMMAELGMPTTAAAVAAHYRDILDGFVLDRADAALAGDIETLGLDVRITETVMQTLADRTAVARAVLDLAAAIATGR
jgi:LPPG:FO 2-phospho-L-lactate transferase